MSGTRGRIRCAVPFCRRTRGDRKGNPVTEGMEWICGEHWVVTSRAWRWRLSLFRRRGRSDLVERMWDRLKRQAIERAMGV